MDGSLLRVSLVVLVGAVGLSACAPRDPTPKSPRAVGVNSALGRTLTGSHWCSSPTADKNPEFTELDVRQDGRYVKTFYLIKGDNSLDRRGEERGTWAIVGNQFFTRTMRQPQLRQKLTVNAPEPTETARTAAVSRRDQTETCVSFGAGDLAQTFCSCQIN